MAHAARLAEIREEPDVSAPGCLRQNAAPGDKIRTSARCARSDFRPRSTSDASAPDLLAERRHFVDERDRGRQEGVQGMFGHFG